MSIDEYGIHILGLYPRFYAMIIIVGIFAATWLTSHRAKARGLNEEFAWNALLWVAIPGVLGARLYHVFTPQPSAIAPDGSGVPLTTLWYFQHPQWIFAIWTGGLGIYGGMIGGVLGAYLYCRYHKQPLLLWLDLVAPGFALGQGIGRWGNFVNHELYGAPTTLPWGIYIPPANRIPGFERYDTFHPLFFYEFAWNVATCIVLLQIDKRFRGKLRNGDLTLMYLMSYATIRFLLDFIRLDSNGIGPLTTAQMVSLATFIVSGVILFLRHRVFTPASNTTDTVTASDAR